MKTTTELVAGRKEIDPSEVTIERGGKIGIFRKTGKLWDAVFTRGKWKLTGNWSPDYAR